MIASLLKTFCFSLKGETGQVYHYCYEFFEFIYFSFSVLKEP